MKFFVIGKAMCVNELMVTDELILVLLHFCTFRKVDNVNNKENGDIFEETSAFMSEIYPNLNLRRE